MSLSLSVDNLACQRGGRTIVAGVAFRLNAGEGLRLVGANGTGKTTLLRTLAGLLAPASGTIVLQNGSEPLDAGESCHYVGHRDGIKSVFTVSENLSFWRRYLSADDRETGSTQGLAHSTVAEALRAVRLDEIADVPSAYLSAGQKRRLGLARLLVASRPLWLLDEPTVSLDEASRRLFAGFVNRHLERGGIAIVATHVPLDMKLATTLTLGETAAPAAEMATGDRL